MVVDNYRPLVGHRVRRVGMVVDMPAHVVSNRDEEVIIDEQARPSIK